MGNNSIEETINALPSAPGVYLMRNAEGRVFYVGKAKRLRDRVRGYFSGADTRAFVSRLAGLLHDLEVVLTHSEKEALILENELIKKFQPRFNVKLTDDSRYLCLRLDTRRPYPRLEVVRRFAQDGARYFGPFHSALAIRETLRIVNRHFQLRTCSDQVMRNRSRPCLQYQIKRCPAPCVYDLSDGSYDENVAAVVSFLHGRTRELLTSLQDRMQRHAEKMEYEIAARLRDQIRAVERSLERQRVVTPDFIDRDVVGLYREGAAVEVHVMRTREGRPIDAKRFSFSDQDAPTPEVLADFAVRYYSDHTDLPNEILFPAAMEWQEALTQLLSEQRGKAVRVAVPQRGDKKRLVELANKNAAQAFADKQRQAGAARDAVERLQRALRLERRPESIECFDISHHQGKHIVASCVRFELGVPVKDLYRRYKIRSTVDQDDFKSMYEVVSRRARRGLEEGDLPALILIDGGKGQLNAAHAALTDHGVDGVDLLSLAKSRLHDDGIDAEATSDTGARSPERVFVYGRKNPVVLKQDSAELFVLTRARDEAHRFAITFHRQQKRKAAARSVLDGIAGIGAKRRAALLRAFGSVQRMRSAKRSDIAAVVGEKMAARVVAALDPGEEG